jgi:CDGSH iron-sulfur domain-containing protein 3
MGKMYDNKKNYVISAKAGESFAICKCGETSTPPLCDGTHKKNTSGIKPFIQKSEKDEDLFVCGCGGSQNKPFCDGTHNRCPEHDDYMNRW